MKMKDYRNRFHTPVLALALVTGVATAGTTETVPTLAPAPAEDVISGVLKLDFNTHFISYGADVWGDGSSMSEPAFNPMLELAFALPADLTFTLGTWMDFVPSSKGGDSPIGGRLQEVDVSRKPSRSACSTRSPAPWPSARPRSATSCFSPSTRSTPPAASWARRSSPSSSTAPRTGRSSPRRPSNFWNRTRSP
jgi:hypothetical protein